MAKLISKITIKWNSENISIENLNTEITVGDLKDIIKSKTGVLPERQKLLNLKNKGKPAANDLKLCELNIKPNMKIMMMGTKEENLICSILRKYQIDFLYLITEQLYNLTRLENISIFKHLNYVKSIVNKKKSKSFILFPLNDILGPPPDVGEVVNDFDIDENVEIKLQNMEEHLAKIDKRIQNYEVKKINDPRPNKKLLVLDVDYTLFDHRSNAEKAEELMRPYLHEFLTEAYVNYDIVIWSATSMKWIEVKMAELGVTSNTNYKIAFFMDSGAMITVHTPEYGIVNTKPLGVIWGKYKDFYSSKNTIMFDDLRRNFLMNPQNGLKIRPFKSAHINRSSDAELLYLSKYLRKIAELEDFSNLQHKKWERYIAM